MLRTSVFPRGRKFTFYWQGQKW